MSLFSKKILTEKLILINQLFKSGDLLRPRDDNNLPGGIINLKKDISTIIVPDLHGRVEFITKLLKLNIDNKTVLTLLKEDKLQIVCVGDAFHSESRGKLRWLEAAKEYQNNFETHKNIDEEMYENFELINLIMSLKIKFPNNFHFLKGNHENIKNEEGYGNHSFGKYTFEGEMVKDWVYKFYGDEFIESFYKFEKNLPLLAIGNNFIISHAEPANYYSRDEIINYRNNPDVVFGLTWTANSASKDGSVEVMLKSYLNSNIEDSLYFSGHRPVSGLYYTRAYGKLLQIHNPLEYNVAYIKKNSVINKEKMMIRLDGEN